MFLAKYNQTNLIIIYLLLVIDFTFTLTQMTLKQVDDRKNEFLIVETNEKLNDLPSETQWFEPKYFCVE